MGTPARPTRLRTPAGAYRVTDVTAQAAAPVVPASATPPSSTGRLRHRRTMTLRMRILLALVSVAALPLLATAGGGILLARSSLINQGQQALLGRAQGTASKIDSYLEGTRTGLLSATQPVAALLPQLDATDPTVQQNTLHSIEGLLASVRSGGAGTQRGQVVDYVNTSGTVVASDPTGDEGANLHKAPAVVAALAGHVVMTGAAFDPEAPTDLRETFTVAVPVLPAGAAAVTPPIGALVERFSIQTIAGWVQLDTDTQGSGGMLVEPQTGLVLAESLPPNTYAFTSLVPLSSSTVQDLEANQRYVPAQPGGLPAIQPIPGLNLNELKASAPRVFSAGTFGGSNAGTLTYVRVPLANAPNDTPWVYLLATPRSVLTAPADQLLILAGSILLVALMLSVVAGVFTARWISSWIVAAVHQLSATASAFLRHSDEQRQTTEEQRHRLGGARTALHDLHRLGGEVTEALEQGINFLEDGQRGRMRPTYGVAAPGGAPAQFGAAALSPQEKQAWWVSWAQRVQDRLRQVHEICEGLARDAQVTAGAASRLRERGAAVYTQASALDASLWVGGAAMAVAPRETAGPTAQASRRERQATKARTNRAAARAAERQVGPGFNPRVLRLMLLGLLVAFGLLPSVTFALTTGRTLRTDLTSQSVSALLVQAQSNESAVDALLNQQRQELYALGNFYTQATFPGSNITNDNLDQALQAAIGTQTQNVGSTLFMLASVPDGRVFAASEHGSVGISVAQLAVFGGAAKGLSATSPAFYDPASQLGWYYIAVPIRTVDQKTVIGVAVGQFPLGPIWQLLGAVSTTSGAQQGMYCLLVEQVDGVVLADSRSPHGVFTATTALSQQAVNALWAQERYPHGQQPPVTSLPQVAAHVQAKQASSSPVSFVSANQAGVARNQFWMIPLVNAPWSLVQALPLAVATGVADQLTRLDLLLLLAVVAVTAGLALLLGQSIIVPVQRLRARFRQASRLLVTITRRQDEAAQRQEAALPPIQTTAELLALETEELASVLFPQQAPRAVAPAQLPAAPGWGSAQPGMNGNYGQYGQNGPNGQNGAYGSGYGGNGTFGGGPSNGNSGANWGAQPDNLTVVDAAPAQQPARIPARGEMDDRAVEALRQSRNMAGDWSLRQQRIMADLAAALNATDELSRASAEGQREAVDLGNMVADILASAR